MRTKMPRKEWTATAFAARDAPTHAQVSKRESVEMKGFALATNLGKMLLRNRPA